MIVTYITKRSQSVVSSTPSDQVVMYLQEFPFFTLTSFPPGFLVHVGGVVSARSVKLLDRIHNPGEYGSHKHVLM